MQIRRHRRRRARRGDGAPWRHLNGSALKNSSSLFLISRAAAGVRGTELGGGRAEAHESEPERTARCASAARHDSAYNCSFTGRAGSAANTPHNASLYLTSVWGGARAPRAIRKTPFIFLATLATTRRG